MGFKFNLERVLKYKIILEKNAQRDYAEARSRLDEQLNLLKILEKDLKNTYNERHRLIQEGTDVSSGLEIIQKAYDGYKIKIRSQRTVVEGFEKIVEEKRLSLIEATKERKIFDKLKEKKHLEYLKDKKREEQKRIDEVNTMRSNSREIE